jgi:WD40 repeat protein
MSESPPLIPDYTLLRRIGGGSYGEVWLARSLTRQFRAIKIVHRRNFDHSRPFDREFAGMLKFEPLSRSHDGLVQILHVGQSDAADSFHYVMELADDQHDGQYIDPERYAPRTLATELAQRRRLPVDECVRIGLSLSAALAHLHKHGLVHRDIKPSNIILVNGVPKLADIGLVTTADQTKSFVGTEGYVPPEGPGTAQADLYSLGKVLYEISTGKDRRECPELPTNLSEAADRHALLELNEVILRACENDARHRYRTADEMHADLVRLERGKSLRRTRSLRRWLPRLRRVAVQAALLGAIVGLGWVIWRERRQQEFQAAMETLSVGDKWARQNRFDQAADCYLRARDELAHSRSSTLPAEVGLWEVYRHAPPPLNTMIGHTRAVRAVVFLPDGRRALSAGDDGSLILWDIVTGRALRSLTSHQQAVWSVAISPDGHRALSAGADHTLKLWDVDDGRELRGWLAHDGAVLGVAFTPDGQHALSAGAGGDVKLWDLESGQVVHLLTGHFGSVFSVAVSSDGRRAVTGGADNTVKLWDMDNGTILRTFNGHSDPVYGVSLSPDGTRAASGGLDGTIRLWDTDTGRELRRFSESGEVVDSVAFSPDGQFVLSGGGDHAARLWRVATGREPRSFHGHRGRVSSVAFSPDGQRALSASEDTTVRLWDVATSLEARSVQAHDGAVTCLAIDPNGRLALSGGDDYVAKVWDIATGLALGRVDLHTNITCAVLDTDGARAALGFVDGAVKQWDMVTGKLQPLAAGTNAVLSMAFSADGRQVESVDSAGNAYTTELATGLTRASAVRPAKASLMERFSGRAQRVTIVALSPDERHVLTASADRTVKLWDAQSGQEERLYFGHTNSISGLSWSPDGQWFATSSHDMTVKLWSAEQKDELLTFNGHTNAVTAVAFRPIELGVVSADSGGTLIVWDVARVRHELEFEPKLIEVRQRLQHNPADAAALATLGEWYAFRGCWDWAAELLEQARQRGADVSSVTLAHADWEADRSDAARGEFRRALVHNEFSQSYLSLWLHALEGF